MAASLSLSVCSDVFEQNKRLKEICESSNPPFDKCVFEIAQSVMNQLYNKKMRFPAISIESNDANENCVCFTWNQKHPVSSTLRILFKQHAGFEMTSIVGDVNTYISTDEKDNRADMMVKFANVITDFFIKSGMASDSEDEH